MTTDPLDDLEPKEQSKAASPIVAAPKRTVAATQAGDAGMGEDAAPSVARHGRAQGLPQSGQAFSRAIASIMGRIPAQTAGFIVAFAVGSAVAFLLFVMLATGFGGGGQKTLTGIHVGTVDISSLTRDQVIQKLQTSYSFLTQGQITITTPGGSDTVHYSDAGRRPDVEVMADAAMSIGHYGNPITDAIASVQSALFGESVPVVIKLDPAALAQRVHQLVGAGEVESKNAVVTGKQGAFTFTPSQTGRGIDEGSLSTAIIDQLFLITPASSVQSSATFVNLTPQVTDQTAEAAIVKAQKMSVDVTLTWGAKKWTIPAATIKNWISFGWKADGTYGPSLDPALSLAYLTKLTVSANTPPVEPSVVWNTTTGAPINLLAGKDGVGVDGPATTAAVSSYLESLADGGSPGSGVEAITGPIHPKIGDVGDMTGMSIIGQWTTVFFPGESNGNGANIRQPAKVLNGTVIGPGQQFSFLGSVGPIDEAHGFAKGGVILSGKSDHTGAMGGGICSASTTAFNAAITAGLQIDERHPHAYFVNRYPYGLDATVFSNGISVYDMKFTNDTTNAIVMRSWATYGRGQNTVTFQLWSLPTHRTVAVSDGKKALVHEVTASDTTKYVSSIAPGKTYRAEYPTNGFDTVVTRVVKDANGTVLHNDVYNSHYVKVDGLLQIGTTPPPASGSPSQLPTPAPSNAPAPTPAPTAAPAIMPAPSAAPRRRGLAG